MTEWKKYKLKEVASFEISSVDKKIKDGQKLVRLCNFVDVYKKWTITKEHYANFMVASAKDSDISKLGLKKGQVAITKDSETRDDIGVATYIADDFEDVVLGYHCALITPNPNLLDGAYLNAFMHSKYIQRYFENNATGSGMRYTLSVRTIEDIPLLLPDLSTQKRIASVLSNIDRKIALNRAMNEELEQTARDLYDYWFLQFDFPDANGKPYRSSGGKMVYNPQLKREIPVGWEVKRFADVLNMYQPATIPSKDLPKNGRYRVYGANGIIGRYDKYNHENSEVAMACRGNSCGTLNRTMPFSWITGNAMIMQLKDLSIHNEFLLQALPYTNISGSITGSGQPQITRESLTPMKICWPSKKVLDYFSQRVAVIVEQQLRVIEENEYLTSLRDELLPLLMNGQVTIAD